MAKTKFEGARQLLLKNVTFFYFKNKPVMYKGKWQWEVSMKTEIPTQAEQWEQEWLNVRSNATTTKAGDEWTVSLNRKTHKADGTPQEPVRVVDENLQPYTQEERFRIGNGSKGHVIIWQGHYDNQHGSGVSTSLTAMQIARADMQWYEGSMETVDFQNLGSVADPAGNAVAADDLF